jgi:hypothetical protein
VRFLSPGSWNLTFSAAGYRDTIINVIVYSGQKTDLIVDMSPITSGIEPINSTTHLLIYPNPAADVINIILPDKNNGRMNLRIINQAGILMSDSNIQVVQGIPVIIDIKYLSAGAYTIVFTSSVTGTSFHGRIMVIK